MLCVGFSAGAASNWTVLEAPCSCFPTAASCSLQLLPTQRLICNGLHPQFASSDVCGPVAANADGWLLGAVAVAPDETHSAAPPSTFSRCINSDGERMSHWRRRVDPPQPPCPLSHLPSPPTPSALSSPRAVLPSRPPLSSSALLLRSPLVGSARSGALSGTIHCISTASPSMLKR